jgi:hypothetical protein
VITARYELSPYIEQTCLVFKGLNAVFCDKEMRSNQLEAPATVV